MLAKKMSWKLSKYKNKKKKSRSSELSRRSYIYVCRNPSDRLE